VAHQRVGVALASPVLFLRIPCGDGLEINSPTLQPLSRSDACRLEVVECKLVFTPPMLTTVRRIGGSSGKASGTRKGAEDESWHTDCPIRHCCASSVAEPSSRVAADFKI
jgi:hypothetical protein